MNQKQLLLGECKWTNKLVDMNVLYNLLEEGKMFPQQEKYYYLFSKNGFQEAVVNYAKENDNLKLIELKDFYKE